MRAMRYLETNAVQMATSLPMPGRKVSFLEAVALSIVRTEVVRTLIGQRFFGYVLNEKVQGGSE